MPKVRHAIDSFLGKLYAPRILQSAAQGVIDSPFYSAKKDEVELQKITSTLDTGGDASALATDITQLAIRLHLHYLKKKEYHKANQFSLSISETMKDIIHRVETGALTLGESDRPRVEAFASYWQGQVNVANLEKSFHDESKVRETVTSSIESGRSDEALSLLENALEEKRRSNDQPGTADSLRQIAEVMKKKGDLEGALERLRVAASIDAHAWFDVAYLLGDLKRYEESIEAYDEFLKTVPESGTAWNNKGWAYENLRDFTKALDAYQKSVTIDKSQAFAWAGIGSSLWNLGRWNESVDAYLEAERLAPESPEVLMMLTALYNDKLKDYAKSAEYAEKAFKLSPASLDARENLAEILISAGRFKEARDHAKKVLDLEKNPSRRIAMYLAIAASYFFEGEAAKGTKWLSELTSYRASLSDFKNDWGYEGISGVITGSKTIGDDAKSNLLEAIKVVTL